MVHEAHFQRGVRMLDGDQILDLGTHRRISWQWGYAGNGFREVVSTKIPTGTSGI